MWFGEGCYNCKHPIGCSKICAKKLPFFYGDLRVVKGRSIKPNPTFIPIRSSRFNSFTLQKQIALLPSLSHLPHSTLIKYIPSNTTWFLLLELRGIGVFGKGSGALGSPKFGTPPRKHSRFKSNSFLLLPL